MVTVKRKRAAAMREDFLVRNPLHRRAIHVVMPYTRDGSPMSDLLSEHEHYWMLVWAADKAHALRWKVCTIQRTMNQIYIKNPSGCARFACSFSQIVDHDHFLNDPALTPKGFWID